MISEKVLRKYHAEKRSYAKGEVIFKTGEPANFYYEIAEGEVKMCNTNEQGKEFIQGIFSKGRCFGEPPLFGHFNYPADAIATEDTVLWRLPKTAFIELLKSEPDIHFALTQAIAARLYYKAVMAQEISHEDPKHRIIKLLSYLKYEIYKLPEKYSYQVELTRQQIADLTGLRVETTIRAIKVLEKEGALRIEQRKLWI